MIEPSRGLLRACDLPEWIARDDGRGRVVAVRQFVKDWAASDALRREQMIADAPRRWRWWHRVGPRRFDIAKISAVVHGLCDRDAGVWVPIIRSWVLTRGFALHPGTRNRYMMRYTRTQHRPA